MSQEIENRIRALLSAKTTSRTLSNALFGPMGLFGKLGATEEQRRAISQTPLYKQAHARIMEIERAEMAADLEAELRRINEVCPPANLPSAEGNGVADPDAAQAPKVPTPD
jgi:hypothetical protein